MALGKLLYASHASLRDDYQVSSAELDAIVQIASQTEGVYGARMMGAGFGGSALMLVRPEGLEPLVRACDRVSATYGANRPAGCFQHRGWKVVHFSIRTRLTPWESASYNTAHARKADAERPRVMAVQAASFFCLGAVFDLRGSKRDSRQGERTMATNTSNSSGRSTSGQQERETILLTAEGYEEKKARLDSSRSAARRSPTTSTRPRKPEISARVAPMRTQRIPRR